MSRMILILGETGTGKTTSLRNFKHGEVQVIACSRKEMPFQTNIGVMHPKGYLDVYGAIEKSTAPAVIIDDTNYLMVADEFNRAKEVGYSKFTDFAISLNRIFSQITNKDSDQTFYVFAHPEDRGSDNNKLEFKISAGKMSKKFPIGGLTNIVLETIIDEDGEFVFKTQTDGTGVKTPIGMFDTPTVPNDLKAVDKQIRDFYKPVTKAGK
jgi:hypothetical protein